MPDLIASAAAAQAVSQGQEKQGRLAGDDEQAQVTMNLPNRCRFAKRGGL